MVLKKYRKYNKCKCGNDKLKESLKCKKCHNRKRSSVSRCLNSQRYYRKSKKEKREE